MESAVNQVKQELQLPASIQAGFRERRKAFQVSLVNEPFLILAALVTVYIVLGVLYEATFTRSRFSRHCPQPESARCSR